MVILVLFFPVNRYSGHGFCVEANSDFYKHLILPGQVNATVIALVPKTVKTFQND